LFAVDAVSARDVWAVGNRKFQTLIEHWDGRDWQVVWGHEGGDAAFLASVVAVSRDDVWAAGSRRHPDLHASGSVLIEHWNGSRWHVVPSPRVDGIIHGLAARAADDVWAVGVVGNDLFPKRALIEHWDGRRWTIVEGTPKRVALAGITVGSKGDLWAVGTQWRTSDARTPIIQRYVCGSS